MHTELKNTKRLKELYSRALTIKSAIPHPRIMGIIRECGGKMHMHERVWSEAATDFFEVLRLLCCFPLLLSWSRGYCRFCQTSSLLLWLCWSPSLKSAYLSEV